MNTRITYRYADKTNCKQYTTIVVAGVLTWEQIQPYLARQHSFIPGQVGLEDLQQRFALPGPDHPWHQITSEDIKPSEAAPTIAVSGAKLVEQFTNAIWKPDQLNVPTGGKRTVGVNSEVQTDTETSHSSVHLYAYDKTPAPRSANGTLIRKTSSRTKKGTE